MNTVLESVDELILEFNIVNTGTRLIHLVLERYQHSPNKIKDFFKSLFNTSYKDKIWGEMLDTKLSRLKHDVDAFLNLGGHPDISSFIRNHILTSREDLTKIVIGEGLESDLSKRLIHFRDHGFAVPGSNIYDDVKSAIFLKHFAVESDQIYMKDTPGFIAKVNDLFYRVHISANISDMKDELIDFLVAKGSRMMTFLDIAFAQMVIRAVVIESVIVKVFKQYFSNDNNDSLQVPKMETPKNYDMVMPIAGAIGVVGAGLGAYSLYKKYKKNPVSFQNFI